MTRRLPDRSIILPDAGVRKQPGSAQAADISRRAVTLPSVLESAPTVWRSKGGGARGMDRLRQSWEITPHQAQLAVLEGLAIRVEQLERAVNGLRKGLEFLRRAA